MRALRAVVSPPPTVLSSRGGTGVDLLLEIPSKPFELDFASRVMSNAKTKDLRGEISAGPSFFQLPDQVRANMCLCPVLVS
jgi:hypothetical protein